MIETFILSITQTYSKAVSLFQFVYYTPWSRSWFQHLCGNREVCAHDCPASNKAFFDSSPGPVRTGLACHFDQNLVGLGPVCSSRQSMYRSKTFTGPYRFVTNMNEYEYENFIVYLGGKLSLVHLKT